MLGAGGGAGAAARRAAAAARRPKRAGRPQRQRPRRRGAAPAQGLKVGGKRKAVPGDGPGTTSGKGPSSRRRPAQRRKEKQVASITETAKALSDHLVAQALAGLLLRKPSTVRTLMRRWEKTILKAPIPGTAGRLPTKAMLQVAKGTVLRFYAAEEALGRRSDVVKAFYLASGERHLRFDWLAAMARVRRARFDYTQEIDRWDECLAMSSGDTNALSEIYVCGTKKVTLRALTSLICHEGLHNLARRVRQGNSYLSEDLEHIAMALIGDPQLVHEKDD